jgi:hypothetical protein
MTAERLRKGQIENTNMIELYLHCVQCLDEIREGRTGPDGLSPMGRSPKEYQRVQVGWTRRGIQVWCLRHDANVMHMDFEGARHPANTSRRLPPKPRRA